jgi:uncharacterized protein (TIGR02452 family)
MSNRKQRIEIAKDTLNILENKFYVLNKQKKSIGITIDYATKHTILYSPSNNIIDDVKSRYDDMKIIVVPKTTLVVAQNIDSENNIVILNFASAKKLGGGWLTGAQAQEESLVRSSALSSCLLTQPTYYRDNLKADATYSDNLIYSPNVPVFKNDSGQIIDHYYASFITIPFPNRKVCKDVKVDDIIKIRVDRILKTAYKHNHDVLVLGAIGCGVFHNDPEVVSTCFREALTTTFKNCFKTVYFAMGKNDAMYDVFNKTFSS